MAPSCRRSSRRRSRSSRGSPGNLPGGYRYTPAKDLADEIEWAKSRRISARAYLGAAGARTPPIPAELFANLYAGYERAKERAGQIDFDDMLTLTVELLETDA